MEYIYQNRIVSFRKYGTGPVIVLLHGWGQSKETFDFLIPTLEKSNTVYALDLPGFGKSTEPDKGWSLDDYENMLVDFFLCYQIKEPIVLGHSFGGRLAIKLAAHKRVSAIILVDSAGLIHHPIQRWWKIKKYKWLKYIYKKTRNYKKYNDLIQISGSNDYRDATPSMKQTLAKVTNENLKKDLKKIHCDCLIIWGKEDTITPFDDALYMYHHIKNAGLVPIDNATHFCYQEYPVDFAAILEAYLKVKN